MDSRKTLFLLVLVGLVGGLVVWDHFKGVPTEEREAQTKRLLNFDAKDITRVDLIRSNQTIVLEKIADNWNIKQPLTVRADFGAVSSILDELEFAEHSRTLTAKDLQGVNRAEFGLAPPRMTIKLHGKTGVTELNIGSETPTKDAFYVSVAGKSPIYVMPKSGFDRSNQTLEQLRSRTVLDFTPAAATRLELKAADRTIELTKSIVTNVGPVWALAHPLAARADQTKVSELLAALENLRVINFVSDKPDDLHTYRLGEPEGEVTVSSGATSSTLEIGMALTNDPSQVYAMVRGADSIFTVPAATAKRFTPQINDLRDARVLVFNPTDVSAIAITHGADKLALHREDGMWQITNPLKVAGDDNAVGELLATVAGLRVKGFVADITTDLEKFGLATPSYSIALTGAGTLLFGAVDNTNGVRYVKRADEPFIYGVATASTDSLPMNYSALRSRQIFNLKPDSITKLAVGDVSLARDEHGRWILVTPAQGVLDADAANALVHLLSGLRAESFGRPKTDLDNALGLTIRATDGTTTHWLSVAKDGEAAASNVELTFRLAAPVVETLTHQFVREVKP